MQLADVSGRIYELGKIDLPGGISNTVELNISSLSLKIGFYYLRVLAKNETDLIKLIVE